METGKTKRSGLLEAVCRNAGVWVGMTAALGKKIAQVSVEGAGALGGLFPKLGGKPAPAPTKPTLCPAQEYAGESRTEKAGLQKRLAAVQPAAPESNPAPVPLEHGPALLESREDQLPLTLPSIESQSDHDSLLSELTKAQFEADEAAAQGDALMSEMAALRSELARAYCDVEEIRKEEEEARSRLASQIRVLKEDKEHLIVDLERSRSAFEEIRTREEALKARVDVIESDLAVARRELQEARAEAVGLRVELAEAKTRWSAVIGTTSAEGETIPPVDNAGQAVSATVDEEGEPSREAIATPANEKPDPAGNGQKSRPSVAVAEAPDLPAVSPEDVLTAVFANSADRVIFTRARSGMVSQNSRVRASAAKALGGIHHELAARILVAQAACEPSLQVRHECIKALTALGLKEGLPAVQRALTDPDVSVRLAAVRGVYRLAGAECAPALAPMLSDSNEDVRRRAATCIGWLGQEEHAVALLSLLDDRSVSVRHAAIEALANLRSRRAVGPLIERLSDPEESIRKAALGVLETITGKSMSESFPADEESRERVIARWRSWWKG